MQGWFLGRKLFTVIETTAIPVRKTGIADSGKT